MEYINEVNINEAVIHILDTASDKPIYNDCNLELSDEAYEFILKHILKALRSDSIKYAVFNQEKNIIKEFSQKYLSGQGDFIAASKGIAKQLFILMKSSDGIPSCDLLEVSISTEFGPMFALLKMDYVKSYTHTIDSIDNKLGIGITPRFSELPAANQSIQKCAFIKPALEENKFDLMLIDKQNKRTLEDYGSNYFTSNFLGCTLINNERDLTSNFIATAESWARSTLKDNAEAAELVRTSVKRTLKEKDSIDVKNFAQEIFKENPDVAENFTQYAKEQGVDNEFQVDKQYVDNKMKRVTLKINNDIKVNIDEDTYNDASRFEVVKNGDGTINMVLKNIKNYMEK